MAQIPKDRLVKGQCKPICRDDYLIVSLHQFFYRRWLKLRSSSQRWKLSWRRWQKNKVGERIPDGKYSDDAPKVVEKKYRFSISIKISNDHSLAARFRKLELRGNFKSWSSLEKWQAHLLSGNCFLSKVCWFAFTVLQQKISHQQLGNITMTCLIIYRNNIEIWLRWHSSNGNLTNENGSYICRLHVLKICRIFV